MSDLSVLQPQGHKASGYTINTGEITASVSQFIKKSAFFWIALTLLGLAISSVFAAERIYPRMVEHALGKAEISSEPRRIITLGWNGEDAVLALGKIPIAMTRYGLFESGVFPWVEAELGTEKPQLLSAGQLDFETMAALRPDLILGIYSGIDAVAYKRLSAIAPTVIYRSGPWLADWREQMIVTGEALGHSDVAAKLIEKTNQDLRMLGNEHPDLKGKTFIFGTYFAGSNGVVVYLPSDPRVQALTELGLKVPASIHALGEAHKGDFSTSVTLENIGSVEADILIMWYGEGARKAAEAEPLFQTISAVERGSYVALDDPVSVWSTSALSVLSIPYGFPKFVPRLAEAARRAEHKQ